MKTLRKVLTAVFTIVCLCCLLSVVWAAQLQQQNLQQVPKAEIIPQGGKKIQLQTPARQLPSQQMIGLAKPDVTCSITASYDQGNSQAIQSNGPMGLYHATQDQPPYEVWSHVKIDFSGIKTDQTSNKSFKVVIGFDYWGPASYGMWGPGHKDFNYVLVLSPGESYVYDLQTNPYAYKQVAGNGYVTWHPLKVTAKVVPDTAAVDSDPGNNECTYTINFVQW